MRKTSLIIGAVCLGCAGLTGIAAQRGSAGDAWVGIWNGGGEDGGVRFLVFAGSATGNYNIKAEAFNTRGCGGMIEGPATGDARRLVVTTPGSPEEGGPQCRITLTRRGTAVQVEEGENCYGYHGMSCGFEGTMNRTSQNPNSEPF